MATTTITIKSDTKLRLDYYKSVFNFRSYDQLLTDILNRTGYATAEDIRRTMKLQKEG